ncbi:MAG: helix-hairpin-helix domain-containing protein [Desulfobacteraceae bacterium]|nr:helix-hairpin-helix domain-containing protein [Desulfobacteraceae bacterium]
MIIGMTAAVWAADSKININTATVEELAKLQRVTPKLAADIAEYRAKNGNFKTIDDLKKVKGFDDKLLKLNKDLITVGDSKKN